MRKLSFLLFFSTLAGAGFLLALRFVLGPFRTPLVSVNSPYNAASAVAAAFVLLSLLSARRKDSASVGSVGWIALAVIAVSALAAFWPNLRAPFVYDDYTHIVQTARTGWRVLTDAFRREPAGHGIFFRPIGFISYWLDYRWAARDPVRWHAWNLAVHALNSALVWILARKLGIGRAGCLAAGLLFALHGSRAETVAWSDARFDLLAAFFTFCALLAALEFCRAPRPALWLPVLACTALAVYTKESAFCLPLMPLALLPLLHSARRRRALFVALVLAAFCTALFAYRWWALGGIGGYQDGGGGSTLLQSSPFHSAKALFFREWAFLFFPVNWIVPPRWWLSLPAAGFIASLIAYAWHGGGPRRYLTAGIAFQLAAALPVHHLLLFQPDFAGARVLYLPVAGLAIFWGALIGHVPIRKLQWSLAGALVVFNIAALEHNLIPWRTTPAAAAAACRDFGREIAGDPRRVFVSGLPERLDGVYFLSNGFPECVDMNSGRPAEKVIVAGTPSPEDRRFRWNPLRKRFEELR